jgi:hypothetical protein
MTSIRIQKMVMQYKIKNINKNVRISCEQKLSTLLYFFVLYLESSILEQHICRTVYSAELNILRK